MPSTLVSEIVDIELKNICCITFIENKTNYDEYLLAEKQPEELVVYHGGFLSPRKKKLFEKLAAAAGETMQIRFWADIDLGGFCMFENLQTVFPQLEPMRMEGALWNSTIKWPEAAGAVSEEAEGRAECGKTYAVC